jgi:DNA-binding Lrp family transcriptional regulator
MIKIDELDGKILRVIMKDSRKKISDIARDCKISSTAVIKRIEKNT